MNSIQPLAPLPVRFGDIKGRAVSVGVILEVSGQDYDQFQSLCRPDPKKAKSNSGEIHIFLKDQMSLSRDKGRDTAIDLIKPHERNPQYPAVAAEYAKVFTRQSLEVFKKLIERIPSIPITGLAPGGRPELNTSRLALQDSLQQSLVFTLSQQAGYDKMLALLAPQQ